MRGSSAQFVHRALARGAARSRRERARWIEEARQGDAQRFLDAVELERAARLVNGLLPAYKAPLPTIDPLPFMGFRLHFKLAPRFGGIWMNPGV